MYGSDTRWICSALSHWDESSALDRSDITSLNTESFIKSNAAALSKNKLIFVESSMGLEKETLNPLDWILGDWICLICRLRGWRERRAEKDGGFLVFLKLIFNIWPLCSLQMFPCTSVSIQSWWSKWEPSHLGQILREHALEAALEQEAGTESTAEGTRSSAAPTQLFVVQTDGEMPVYFISVCRL